MVKNAGNFHERARMKFLIDKVKLVSREDRLSRTGYSFMKWDCPREEPGAILGSVYKKTQAVGVSG